MKCTKGDLAQIIYSVRPENIGRIVKCVDYIGKFKQGEQFEFRGMPCQCPVTDHYWWIEAEDLSSLFGPSPRAYIADSWLEPLKNPNSKTKEKVEKELDIAA
jgi:hypothetical protein|tara:strand:+ start:648 stop:953 length:306 start_codon:yes stop_codon:yes gene_type:complete